MLFFRIALLSCAFFTLHQVHAGLFERLVRTPSAACAEYLSNRRLVNARVPREMREFPSVRFYEPFLTTLGTWINLGDRYVVTSSDVSWRVDVVNARAEIVVPLLREHRDVLPYARMLVAAAAGVREEGDSLDDFTAAVIADGQGLKVNVPLERRGLKLLIYFNTSVARWLRSFAPRVGPYDEPQRIITRHVYMVAQSPDPVTLADCVNDGNGGAP